MNYGIQEVIGALLDLFKELPPGFVLDTAETSTFSVSSNNIRDEGNYLVEVKGEILNGPQTGLDARFFFEVEIVG